MDTPTPLPEAVNELRNWLKKLDDHLRSLNTWTNEVTDMLHKIDWDKLARDYGRSLRSAGDPPAPPPAWPPK